VVVPVLLIYFREKIHYVCVNGKYEKSIFSRGALFYRSWRGEKEATIAVSISGILATSRYPPPPPPTVTGSQDLWTAAAVKGIPLKSCPRSLWNPGRIHATANRRLSKTFFYPNARYPFRDTKCLQDQRQVCTYQNWVKFVWDWNSLQTKTWLFRPMFFWTKPKKDLPTLLYMREEDVWYRIIRVCVLFSVCVWSTLCQSNLVCWKLYVPSMPLLCHNS
jgi:hypothetical protein